MRTDPNLHFAILAFRLGLVDAVQFTEALSRWSMQADKTLADVLTDNGWLTADGRRQVETVLREFGQSQKKFLPGDQRSRETSGPVRASNSASFPTSSPFEPTVQVDSADEVLRKEATVGADEWPPEMEASSNDVAERSMIPDGERRSRYVLTKLHAIGGLGRIWVAWDEHLHRQVALKELTPRQQHSPQTLRRFLREAQITGQLEHPSIVPVYELATDPQRAEPFYVMRLVRGKTLRKSLDEYHEHRRAGRQDPLELSRLLNAFIDVCNAVAYAHSRGVVHRDLKPDNVVLGSFGEVVLLDWGLAKTGQQPDDLADDSHGAVALSEAASIEATHIGSIMGTPAYMAPEQAAGQHDQVDSRTDVYGLGAILFCLLTGRPPHSVSKPLHHVLSEILEQPTPHVRSVDARLPMAIDAICAKAMAKDRSERYGQVGDLADDIQRYLVDEPVSAWREKWPDKLRRWRLRNPAVVSGFVALVLTSVAALMLGLFLLGEEQAATDEARRLAELAQQSSERRAFSETAARLDAERARSAEARERRQAELLAAEMVFRRGLALCEQGNVAVGQLWFARGLGMMPHDELALANVFRANLGSWSRRLTPLQHIFDQAQALTQAAFSPDGRLVVTAGADRTGRLWDAHTGQPVGELLLHNSGVEKVLFSPDGRLLATAAADAAIWLWEVPSGKLLGQLRAHSQPIRDVSFSPDGQTLATASDDDSAILWDVATRQPRDMRLQHHGHVWAIEFSPNGTLIATGSADQTAQLWDATTGKSLGEPLRHMSWVWDIAFRPDSQALATGSADGEVRVWDVTSGTQMGASLKHDGDVRALDFSPDGRTLLTGCGDNLARLWDVATGKLLAPPLRHHGPVRVVGFSLDGTKVLTGSMDNTAQVWEAATGLPFGPPIEHQGQLRNVELSPDGKQLLTASADGTARLWDVAVKSPLEQIFVHGGPIQDLAVSRDGQFLLTAGSDRRARLWRLSDGMPVAESPEQKGLVLACAIDPAGKRFACAGAESWLRFYATANGAEAAPAILHPAPIEDIAITADGQFVATGCWDGHARIFDANSGSPASDIAAHEQMVRGVAFSHGGRLLATGSPDGTARIWDVASGKPASPPLHHDDQITGLVFSPDDHWLATASVDKSVRLWYVSNGELVPQSFRHRGPVRCVAFSPDGGQLVTGSHDKTARRWDVTTGHPVTPPWEHAGSVSCVAFLPNGQAFVTGCSDGTARIWDSVPSATGSPEEVTLWVEVMTGMELTESGFVRVLSAAAWRERQDRWKSLDQPLQR